MVDGRAGGDLVVAMKTVLLLDDDKDFRSLLVAPLRARDLDVLESATCVEADKLFASNPVDLVLVDGLLPDGPGVRWIERLRAHDKKTRVVFLSAFWRDLKTFEHLTRDLDVSLVVYKPIQVDDFVGRVLLLLDMSGTTLPPSSETGKAVADALIALKSSFSTALPARLDEIDAALEAARKDPARIAEARNLAHRLRGSAGSFGFAGVGVAVGVIEDLLDGADSPPRAILWEELGHAQLDARQAANQGERLGSGAAGTKPLLVLDDDVAVLQQVRNLGRKQLINVVTARTPAAAMQLAQEHPLLGAILEVRQKSEESFSLARDLRSTPQNAGIPVAFSSTDYSIQRRVAAIEAGGTRFLEKPLTEESLASLAQQFVNLSQAEQGRVLIVDDDKEVVQIYSHRLRTAGYRVEALESADILVERLEEFRPDVLLLDVRLPRMSGIDVCKALRMSDRWQLLPILIVTAQADHRTRLQAFRAGASDLVPKPILAEELLARVNVHFERARLLRDRTDKDPLSGLLLRRALMEAFQRALAIGTREQRPLSLVLLDLDHFKHINDEYGHLAGDQVIARLGELLRRRFRVEDLRGRWGGEEFILIFPGQTAEFAAQAAQMVLEEFRAMLFVSDRDDAFGVSFTAGVASCPEDGLSIASLIRCADERLYAGKQRGRNQISLQGNAPAT